MSDNQTPLANFSPERREVALAVIRGSGVLTHPAMTYESRLLYAVGTLICDDAGLFEKAAVNEAMSDPSIVQAARALLREARP